MPKKRGHGEGSIYRRKEDGLWVAELYLGRDANGKKVIWRQYGKTRREVAEALTEQLKKKQDGLLASPSKQTLGQFLDAWLNDVVKGTVRPYTFASYKQMVKHFAPLAPIPLAKLTPQQVQWLYRQKRDEGLTRTIVLMHGVLHKALGQAVKWGLVPRNIADAVEVPRVPRKQFRALTPEEASAFLEAAREDRLFALYALAISCGLRLGELLGLRWEDVDMKRRVIVVRHQLQYSGGKPVLAEPKTDKARRTIRLPVVALAALKRHRANQFREKLRLGEAWQDTGFVFTTEIGTPLSPSNVRNRSFYPLLQKAGLPRIRFHDLRHTCATLLLAQGVHPKLVQELLGHAEIGTTLDRYSHVLPAMMEEVAQKMDSVLATAHKKAGEFRRNPPA